MEAFAGGILLHNPKLIDLARAIGPPAVALLAALVALCAAVIASYIQYNQWKTAKDKLRLDLFDKRMAVYNTLIVAFMEMPQLSTVPQADLRALHLAVEAARFLFAPEIAGQVDRMYALLERQRTVLIRWKAEDKDPTPGDTRLGELANEQRELSTEMDRNLLLFPTMFAKVLYFGNIDR